MAITRSKATTMFWVFICHSCRLASFFLLRSSSSFFFFLLRFIGSRGRTDRHARPHTPAWRGGSGSAPCRSRHGRPHPPARPLSAHPHGCCSRSLSFSLSPFSRSVLSSMSLWLPSQHTGGCAGAMARGYRVVQGSGIEHDAAAMTGQHRGSAITRVAYRAFPRQLCALVTLKLALQHFTLTDPRKRPKVALQALTV